MRSPLITTHAALAERMLPRPRSRHRSRSGDAVVHGDVLRASPPADRRAVRLPRPRRPAAAGRVDPVLLRRPVLDRPAGRRGDRRRQDRHARAGPPPGPPADVQPHARPDRAGRPDAAARPAATTRRPGDASGEAGPSPVSCSRSAAVTGWPTMDVRAFSTIVPAPDGDGDAAAEQWAAAAAAAQLTTLRLERLSPSVLLALFDGVPALVWCEEPHHGVRVRREVFTDDVQFSAGRHDAGGQTEQNVARRCRSRSAPANVRVVAVAGLRDRLRCAAAGDPQLPAAERAAPSSPSRCSARRGASASRASAGLPR